MDKDRLSKLIKENKAVLEWVKDLRVRVKKLEQQNSYYPTEEEISSIKVGGTD